MSDFFFLDVRSQRNFALDKWIRLLYGASKRFLKRIKLLSENANSLKFYFYLSRHLPRRLGNYSEGWRILAAAVQPFDWLAALFYGRLEKWKRICLLLRKISRYVILLHHLTLSTWSIEYFVFVRLNFSFVSFETNLVKSDRLRNNK